ncbi:MAG: outer membrane protein assembly factor BamB [Planctomycetota bacterium]|jgi:outer membrane protein assembly factor BamB
MHQIETPHILSFTLLALSALAFQGSDDGEALDGLDTWQQWRGPERDGSAPGTSWAKDLTEEQLEQTWVIDQLGPSYSGPVVDSERVYTTETVDEKFEVVRAFSRATGEELWQTRWTGSMEVPFFAARNGSWIRSTPVVDENSLYVAGIQDTLTCLDVQTGDVRWSVNFSERFDAPPPPFGCASSPLLEGQDLYIQAGASLVKLDKSTGMTIWRSIVETGDVMSAGAFSSPVLAELCGQPQLVVQSRTELFGIDAVDGRELWSTPVKAFRGMNILTPTIVGDGVFTSSYGGRSHLFMIRKGEDGLKVEEEWESRLQGYMTSPVVVDGHAYLFLKSNRFGCVDLSTGEERWTSPPTGDSYWSLAVQGNRILALSDTGILRFVKADPSAYEVLSEREVTEGESWAHVAPAGAQVFVRSLDSLIALSWN